MQVTIRENTERRIEKGSSFSAVLVSNRLNSYIRYV